jgi:Na+-translocating ferredoxin:NAD+ oxidoreductase RnfD subunit
MKVGRFFRTPKGLLLVALSVILIVAALHEGVAQVMPGLAAAIVAGAAFDAVILRVRRRRWVFPDGAILTGMLVAMVLSPHEPWWIPGVTTVVGVLAKYVVRVGKANVFNPAALGLVATFYVYDTAQNWWGAMPDVPLGLVVLFVIGLFIAQRVNKAPVVIAFLGTYYVLFTVTAFVAVPVHVAEIYRAPDLQMALFFAFFMVSDPPTSPPKDRDQMAYGVIVGVVSFVFFEAVGAAYFLLAGLLAGNLWEAWRRAR